MDFLNMIKIGNPLDIRLQWLVRDAILYVIERDPSLNEKAKARARPLRIPENEWEDFTTQVGPIIVRRLLNLRRLPAEDDVFRSLFMVPCLFKDFMVRRCREWFSEDQPQHYVEFLILISEFCCRMANVGRFQTYFCSVMLEAEYYMHLFNGVFQAPVPISSPILRSLHVVLSKITAMDFLNMIEIGNPLEIRLQRLVRDTILNVIESDPSLNEKAKARARSLRIPETEREDFTTQVGPIIVRRLLNLRRLPAEDDMFRSLFMVPCLFKDFMVRRCRELFGVDEPQHYVEFLILISEFCCRMANVGRFQTYFCLVMLEAEYYMHLFNGVFPTTHGLIYYIHKLEVHTIHRMYLPVTDRQL